MSRLQKKCFVGATSVHLLLLLALFVGPGFFTKEKVDDTPMITIIPMVATESGREGGGTPQPQTTPTPAPPAPQPPVVQQPPPVKREVEQVRQPDPPKQPQSHEEVPERRKIVKEDPTADPTPDKPKKHEVSVNKNVVKISQERRKPSTSSSSSDTSAQETAERDRAAANARLFANAGKNISKGLAPSTQVNMPEGVGGGGFSYAPYAQIVRKIYTDAWRTPDDATDDEATVKVSVTIARDGSVISSRIIAESGSKLVDRSIQNTLDRVRTIGVPFPTGAKESQRTFTISFSLKARRLTG